MVDIDQFKSINDTYGHQMGDLAISLFFEHIQRGKGRIARIHSHFVHIPATFIRYTQFIDQETSADDTPPPLSNWKAPHPA